MNARQQYAVLRGIDADHAQFCDAGLFEDYNPLHSTLLVYCLVCGFADEITLAEIFNDQRLKRCACGSWGSPCSTCSYITHMIGPVVKIELQGKLL